MTDEKVVIDDSKHIREDLEFHSKMSKIKEKDKKDFHKKNQQKKNHNLQITKDGNYPKYLYRQITEGIEEWRSAIIGYDSNLNNDKYDFEIRMINNGDPEPFINYEDSDTPALLSNTQVIRAMTFQYIPTRAYFELNDEWTDKHPRGESKETDYIYDLYDYYKARAKWENEVKELEHRFDWIMGNDYREGAMQELMGLTDKRRFGDQMELYLEDSTSRVLMQIDRPSYFESMENLISARKKAFGKIDDKWDTGNMTENLIQELKNSKKPLRKVRNNLAKLRIKYDLGDAEKNKWFMEVASVDGERTRQS